MIGARCTIIGTAFDGYAVGRRQYLGEPDRYAVRYSDHSGPQERWFTVGEISFQDREAVDNVVALRAGKVMA